MGGWWIEKNAKNNRFFFAGAKRQLHAALHLALVAGASGGGGGGGGGVGGFGLFGRLGGELARVCIINY